MVQIKRREFIKYIVAAGVAVPAALGGAMAFFGSKQARSDESFPISMSEAQWREKLTEEEFRILRKEGTEPAFKSPLHDEKRDGAYHCAGCDNDLFSSAHKFDSGTGWPSFYKPAEDGAVATRTDYKLIYPRTEVHCADCGGHLGHVFDDGPEPTGKRYCINGAALDFKPAE